jgi:hypothetical protein
MDDFAAAVIETGCPVRARLLGAWSDDVRGG